MGTHGLERLIKYHRSSIEILGWHTSFFMLHGIVAIGGLWAGRHLIRRGIHLPRSLKIALTFLFIYFSSLLIFHEGGVGTRLLNWGMGMR